jgi:MFS transporter, DHA3 family, tetracycline resistance protein
MLLSLIATEFVRRSVDIGSQRIIVRALFIANTLTVCFVLLFALAGNFWLAVAGYLLYGVVRGAVRPIYTTWLTCNIDAQIRATLISVSGQMDALGQIVGGPPVGYIGSVFSLRAALITVSIILSPILLLLESRSSNAILEVSLAFIELDKLELIC